MKKKDLENEELDEIIEDEAEIIDDEAEDVIIDDDEIDEEEEIVDEAPKTKKAKTNKKPLKKGAKIAIITSSSIIGVVAIVLVVLFVILPLFNGGQSGKIKEDIDFSKKVAGFEQNPTDVTSSSDILNALVFTEDDLEEIYSSSKDKNLIAAQMLFAATKNLATAHQYSYFKNQIGTTNLGSKSGTLIVQRMRRQNQDIKDDTTLKLPYNHNFGPIETTAVTGEGKVAVRYIKEGGIYRIKSSKITYDSKTGFLVCDAWARGKNWGDSETPDMSANIKEARINYLSLVEGMTNDYDADDNADISKPKAIFKKSSAKIEDKGDYYEIFVEVDSSVANNDEDTMSYFNEDNGTSDANIAKCEITYQVWKCGLPKSYSIDETWSGKIQVYEGEANAKSECRYSYTDKDCNDDSATEAIWKSLKK